MYKLINKNVEFIEIPHFFIVCFCQSINMINELLKDEEISEVQSSALKYISSVLQCIVDEQQEDTDIELENCA